MSEIQFGLLGDIAKGKRGVSYKPEDIVQVTDQKHYRLLTAGNIQDGITTTESYTKVPDKCVLHEQLISPDDILVCMSNGSKRLVGKSSRLRSADSKQYCVGAFCSTFTPTGNADPEFVFQIFQSEIFKRQVSDALEGSAINNLKNSTIENFQVPLPPLPEQKKIAEILSGIDMRIKLGEQRISQLEVLLMSAGAKFFGPDSYQSTKTIGEMFEVSSGSTPSRGRQDYFCSHGGTPWVKTMDLNNEIVTITDEQITNAAIHEGRARVFPKGTLLLAMYGGWNQIGRTGILGQNSSCNQAMSALLPSAEVSPGFLNLQLVIRRSYWKSVAASSRKDPNITKSDVQNMPIIVPSLEKQQKVKEVLESIIESARKERAYISSLQLLKSSLSSDLLSGRKRVSV